MLPALGALSVVPGRYDSRSIAAIRRCLTDQPHPIAIAPEGQVSYHNERVAALEPGTAQLAFWCLEDLRKAGRSEEVLIVPACTSYHYDPRDWRGLLRLLAAAERESGLTSPPVRPGERLPPDDAAREAIHARIMKLWEKLVDTAERHYTRFHGARFGLRTAGDSGAGRTPEGLQERMAAVCEAAIRAAERFFGIVRPDSVRGDFVQRVFATRQAGLQWMFREDIADLEALSPVERALADRVAIDAWIANRHVELVDLLEYLRVDYLTPRSGFDRWVEVVTNLWDLANRLQGGNISGRANPFWKTARIIVGEPIRVSPLWESYRQDRRRAVSGLTEVIFAGFRQVAESGNRPPGRIDPLTGRPS
jgi:hypothetical protein